MEGKYGHLIVDVPMKEDRLGIVAHVYGGQHFAGKDFTPAWVGITAPLDMIKEAHAHPYDEYLFFFGGDMNDITKFDAEADLCMGEEEELYVIISGWSINPSCSWTSPSILNTLVINVTAPYA